MKTLAVAAGAIHGLSLSIAYGGPVFAKIGLKRGLRHIASKGERRAVMQAAWKQFSKVDVPAHVGFTASWLVLRSLIRRVYVDRHTKHLLVAKDVFIAGALLTGVAATITGKALSRALPGKAAKKPTTPTKPGETPSLDVNKPNETKRYNKLLRLEKKLGRANMAFLAASIIISPAIGVGIFRSQRMGLLARIFNR